MRLHVAPTYNQILFKITAFKYVIKDMVICCFLFVCFIIGLILLMNYLPFVSPQDYKIHNCIHC